MPKQYNMLKEIKEQPEVVMRMVKKYIDSETHEVRIEELERFIKELKNVERFTFLGNGSSSYAAMYGNYVFEEIVGLPCEHELADEFISRKKVIEDNTGVIVLSQSGETRDILEAVKQIKKENVSVIVITNSAHSTITLSANVSLITPAGEEKGIAATKSFTAQLLMLLILALYIDQENKTDSTLNKEIVSELGDLGDRVNRVLSKEREIKDLAKHLYYDENFIVLGRHYQYPIALEGAQKIKETTYIQAEGQESEEFRHGPMAIVDKGFSVISLMPGDKEFDKNLKVVEEIVNAKGRVYPISDKEVGLTGVKPTLIIPKALETVMPVISVVALQLLAYYIAIEKGIDIDKSRNIRKCI